MNKTSLAKKIWGLIYPMLIYLGIQILVVFVIELSYVVYWHMNGVSSSAEINRMLNDVLQGRTLLLTLISALVTIPILAVFMKKDIDAKKEAHTLVKYKPINKLFYLLIIPFGIFNMEWANMFVSILQVFMPKFMIDSYSGAQTAIYGSSVALQLITGGIVAPVVEEMIFRGLIYKRTKELTGIKIAAVISAVLFGVFHGNWVQAPYAIIIGLVAVFVYEKYKSIIAPILLHMSANMASVGISYFAAKMTQQQTIDTQQFSAWYIVKALSSPMVMFLGLAVGMGIIINSIVRPKEVENETIDSNNTML